MLEHIEEDVGNIVLLEHVNVQVSDQAKAILFYIVGLGFTRDPYLTVGLENMWVNVGEQQFHLPTREAQVIPGHIALVMPDLARLQDRLKAIQERLAGTRFTWAREEDCVAVTCPWGNQFRCFAPDKRFEDMKLGLPYVEFLVKAGASEGIARFYQQVMRAPAAVHQEDGRHVARIAIGRNQEIVFRETEEAIPAYDGHHIAIYVANFSAPYGFLKKRNLIMEEIRNHQFRFKDIVNIETGKPLFQLEHEVRSMHHPMYRRPLFNRDPDQTQRAYRRGRDALIPYAE
ncbi:MAG: VOC family protein [Candidatus Binatia bacterium]